MLLQSTSLAILQDVLLNQQKQCQRLATVSACVSYILKPTADQKHLAREIPDSLDLHQRAS